LKQEFIEKYKRRDIEKILKQEQREENELKLRNEAKVKAKEKYDKLQAKIELAEEMQEKNREQKIIASKNAERIMEARKFEQ
jgi:hypothetical protein